MAAVCQAIFLFVVCGLLQCMKACSVTCTTDYNSTLNCSTFALGEALAFHVEAICRDEYESVNGSCVIEPPHEWCIIKPNHFYQMTNPDTLCELKATQLDQPEMEECSWNVMLTAIFKPQQPFNLTLSKAEGYFNLSWDMVYTSDDILPSDLVYRVRLRPTDDLEEKQYTEFQVTEDRRHQEIWCELLLPGKAYVASIQASVNLPNTTWSEWSTSSEWTCPYTDSSDLKRLYLLLSLLLVVFLFAFLFFLGKQGRLKKLSHFQYIPNPQDFFKPLYHTYQGDFKKWVGPVLTLNSLDILEKSVPLQVLSEKQLAALPLQRELLQETCNGSSCLGDWSLLSLVNPSSSKRYFLGGSSLGHISMDTVTVSGQEGTISDWNGGSDRNRLDPGFHRAGQRAPGVSDEDDVLGLDERQSLEEQGSDVWQANDMDHIEEISLDSYSSNEHSDDGYPQMGLDLDTIDSGFLESDCSSPMNSECDGDEQMNAALLGDGVGAHSNYVKQWVAFIPMSEDNSEHESL